MCGGDDVSSAKTLKITDNLHCSLQRDKEDFFPRTRTKPKGHSTEKKIIFINTKDSPLRPW